uniref:Uncharacterized protein n=1 Tax=Amazona collaria TaxID=241587 RepID=A0A8B9GIR5_9PSIT
MGPLRATASQNVATGTLAWSEQLPGTHHPQSSPPFIYSQTQKSERNLKGHRGVSLFYETGDNGYPEEGSDPWKSVWDLNHSEGSVISKAALQEPLIHIKTVQKDSTPSLSLNILEGEEQPRREIIFIVKGLVHDLNPYGPEISSMCRGLPSYLAYRFQGECRQMNDVLGLSAPSASLPMTPSCVVRLISWREGMPSRGTLTRL